MIAKTVKIYVAGHRGMVGSAICRALEIASYTNIITRTRAALDLRDQKQVTSFLQLERPEIIIDAAARVGGILANNENPYTFLMENLQIQNNLIHGAYTYDVKKFIFLGSSCIYPKLAPQPLKEDYLLTGPLEPTNEWYAIAKIAGVKACEAIRKQFGKDFVSLMPTNLYGPYDNFDLKTSHVLPAMIRKFYEATLRDHAPVNLWGSGTPMREFLHVDDMAQAVVFAVSNILPDYLYNVGTGTDVTIKTLAEVIQRATGHRGEIVWDTSKPDGTPRKLLDSSKLKEFGWSAKVGLEEGINNTLDWFISNQKNFKEIKM